VKASHKCFALIEQFEGFAEWAYPDPASPLARATRGKPWGRISADVILSSLTREQQHLSGAPWTVGIGFTHDVRPGDRISREESRFRLGRELVQYESAVLRACAVEPNQNQFDALVCFAFNVGTQGMAGSSVIRAHNRGDFQAAARAFGLWNKAQGREWPGLTRRRAAEAALYLQPVPGLVQRVVESAIPSAHAGSVPEEHDMPQAIDPERPMTQSTINRAGVVAGGTAAVATVAETVNTVSNVKHGVESLGDWLVPILLLAVVGLCGYIVWERVRQRKGGWA